MPIDYLFIHHWLAIGAIAVPLLLISAWMSAIVGARHRPKSSKKRGLPYM